MSEKKKWWQEKWDMLHAQMMASVILIWKSQNCYNTGDCGDDDHDDHDGDDDDDNNDEDDDDDDDDDDDGNGIQWRLRW